MNEILLYSLIMLAGVFIASCSQILLKSAASRQYGNKVSEYLNARVIAAYVLFGVSMVASLFALRYVPLSHIPILESSVYIFILVLGRMFLKERISKRQLAGMVLIFAGIIIFTM